VKDRIDNGNFNIFVKPGVKTIGPDVIPLETDGIRRAIEAKSEENANFISNPEGSNFLIADAIKKRFALSEVFSSAVSKAHIDGDIHLHILAFVDRPYCSGQNIDYVKKFGLLNTRLGAAARPARNASALIDQILKFSAELQCSFGGAVGWDAVNLFIAPYLVGLSRTEVKQLAQFLIYGFSSSIMSIARGGQAIFSDINLYWEIPDHFAETEAIGPGGKKTGKKYKYYRREAQDFIEALFEVYFEGDALGRPFFWPKPLLHITEKFFETSGSDHFLELACALAVKRGNTYFVFDRGKTAKISECCRLSFTLTDDDLKEAKTPWKMRYSAMNIVTLNLPRLSYQSGGSVAKLLELISKKMDIMAQAHLEKKKYLEHLMSLGESGPLYFLTQNLDDSPYYRLEKATFLMGILGLNETVQYLLDKQLHESEEAYKLGLKIVAFMGKECKRLSAEYKMRFILEQTPAESTAYRLAKLDYQQFENQAEKVVKGNQKTGDVYYTNSTYLNIGAPMDAIERIEREGRFHPLIEAGALTHIWLGESQPPSSSVANLVKKIFYETQNAQVAFSPEFTICNACQKTERGLKEKCSKCGSKNVDGITRITGYFTKISTWNRGKLAELEDRHRTALR